MHQVIPDINSMLLEYASYLRTRYVRIRTYVMSFFSPVSFTAYEYYMLYVYARVARSLIGP